MAYSHRRFDAHPLGPHRSFRWRLLFLTGFFVILLAAVAVRVFSLAIVGHREFVIAATRQQQVAEVLPSLRGTIYAKDKTGALTPLAIEKTFFTLSAVPKDIRKPAETADVLLGVTSLSRSDLLQKLDKPGDPYEVLLRKLDQETADRIRELKLVGIMLEEESRRVYTQGTSAAGIVGFVSYEDGKERGAYGIEKYFQEYLDGERGFFEGEKDAKGYLVSLGKRILNPPVDGDDIVLTIDPNIQFKVEEELAAAMKKWEAESANAIAIEPATGRILALAHFPTFDPNAYSRERDFSVFRMPAIDSQFELGSVFKPITMAAGIDAGVITATTTYRDPGAVRFNTYTVRNFDGQSHGVQTMTQVLEKSLNTGAVFVGGRLGQEKFLSAVKQFGFGEKTGIDFPGEVSGNISNLPKGRDIDFATAAFGQGIAVTPLQMAYAIGAIANHGILMKPTVVERVIRSGGGEEVREPVQIRRVISEKTAETVAKMMVSVIRNGFDNRAGVPGYFVAGKTGTAQIPLKNGRGYSDDVIHTFVGYAPAFAPRFLLLIQLNKPKGNRFAANTLASSFQNISKFILNYYEVPPDEQR